jgi:DNA-binding ferritin-like protein (Dps family)
MSYPTTTTKPPEKTQITVELNDNLYELLVTQAALQDRSMSDLVGEAVHEFVSDLKP